MTLRKNLEALAAEFSKSVLAALRSASLSDLTEGARSSTIPIKVRGGGVRHVAPDVMALTGLLSTRPGLRAEQIRVQLRWDKRTTTKAITIALAERRVSKKGQRRATAYYLA
jgi:hypothetical protein